MTPISLTFIFYTASILIGIYLFYDLNHKTKMSTKKIKSALYEMDFIKHSCYFTALFKIRTLFFLSFLTIKTYPVPLFY